MKVKLSNGDVVDDRRNGSKLKLTVGDYIKILCIIAAVTFAGFAGWFNLKAEVNANAKEVIKIASNTDTNIKQDKDILSMQGDLTRIKTDVSEIRCEQKEQNKLLLEIRDRLPK